jgi:hypothetical protein
MVMPEAAMNEYGLFFTWKNNIRLSGQFFIVQAVPEPI